MTIRWKDASLAQLYCIVCDDPMATWADREAAKEEIMRRAKKRFERRQYKMKAVYPR